MHLCTSTCSGVKLHTAADKQAVFARCTACNSSVSIVSIDTEELSSLQCQAACADAVHKALMQRFINRKDVSAKHYLYSNWLQHMQS